MLFHKKKKQEQTEPAYPHGFSMDAPATSCSGRTFVCAMKGLLIFAASYGAIGAVISSFSLPCYPVAVFVCFLLFSMLAFSSSSDMDSYFGFFALLKFSTSYSFCK